MQSSGSLCSSGGGDSWPFVVVVGGSGCKGGQFMTWSGMQSPFGAEPQGLYTREKLETWSREACQSAPGPCREAAAPAPQNHAPTQTKWSQSKKRTSSFSVLVSVPKNVTHVAPLPCLSTLKGGGRVRSCSVLLRWEQTQLTASFLTVNTAAPLRHGSGTRTPPPPSTSH